MRRLGDVEQEARRRFCGTWRGFCDLGGSGHYPLNATISLASVRQISGVHTENLVEGAEIISRGSWRLCTPSLADSKHLFYGHV